MQYALEGYLREHAKGKDKYDAQIIDAVGDDLSRVLRRHLRAYLCAHEDLSEEQADDEEHYIAYRLEHHTAHSDAAGVRGVLFAERAAHKRVDADAETDGKGDEQILHRKSQ